MRVVLGLLLVGLIAAPAMADLTPSQYNPTLAQNLTPTGEGTVGVYDGAGGIFLDYKNAAVASDYFVVPFAFHWPYATPIQAIQVWHQIAFDNTEIAIISSAPMGGLTGANNFPGPTTWAGFNVSTGTWYVGDVLGTGVPLWNNPPDIHQPLSTTIDGKLDVAGSGIYPFVQYEVHVKEVVNDSYMDLWVNQFAMLFKFSSADPGTWWTGGAIGSPTYGVGFIPEPASLSLLGVGLLSVGAGVWRRRR